jgi:predicted transcriptional regulator
MGLQNEFYSDYLNRRMKIDLQTFRIENNSDPEVDLLHGYGYIEYGEEENFIFTLYVDKKYDHKFVINALDSLNPSDEDIQIIGLDVTGRDWIIFPSSFSLQQTLTENSVSRLSGESKELHLSTSSHYTDKYYYIDITIDPIYRIPFNTSRSETTKSESNTIIAYKSLPLIEYESKSYAISGLKNEASTTVSFRFKKMANNVEKRLLECLRYITGENIHFGIVEIHNKGVCEVRIYPQPRRPKANIRPPIRIEDYPHPSANDSWRLFEAMFEFVKTEKSEQFSYLGTHINAIIGAGPAYYESQSLILSVHIEGMLLDFLEKYASISDSDKEEVKKFKALVKSVENRSNIKERLISALGNMERAGARQILKSLMKRGVIDKDQRDSWIEIRNKYSHPKLTKRSSRSADDFIAYLKVLEMFYRITFHIIRYNGLFNTYSKGERMQETVDFRNP